MAGSGTAQLRGEDMLLRVEHLVVEFGKSQRRVRAVSDVSFDVAAGRDARPGGRIGLRQVHDRAGRRPRPPA